MLGGNAARVASLVGGNDFVDLIVRDDLRHKGLVIVFDEGHDRSVLDEGIAIVDHFLWFSRPFPRQSSHPRSASRGEEDHEQEGRRREGEKKKSKRAERKEVLGASRLAVLFTKERGEEEDGRLMRRKALTLSFMFLRMVPRPAMAPARSRNCEYSMSLSAGNWGFGVPCWRMRLATK